MPALPVRGGDHANYSFFSSAGRFFSSPGAFDALEKSFLDGVSEMPGLGRKLESDKPSTLSKFFRSQFGMSYLRRNSRKNLSPSNSWHI